MINMRKGNKNGDTLMVVVSIDTTTLKNKQYLLKLNIYNIYPITQQSEYLFFFRKAVLDTGRKIRGSAGVLMTLLIDHSASHRFNL